LLCLVELDNGSMSVARLLAKYQLYAAWADSPEGQAYLIQVYTRLRAQHPQPNFRLLVVAHDALHAGRDARRLEDLYTEALELPGPMRDRIWLTTVASLREHQGDQPPLAAPLWLRARDARDFLADYRAYVAALPRDPGQKRYARQRKYVAAQLARSPLHPLFPHPIMPPQPAGGPGTHA
jgi:hypothetical protein